MIPVDQLEEGLAARLLPYRSLPLPDLLQQLQVLPRLAQELIIEQLLAEVVFQEEEQSSIIEQLWKGVSLPAPKRLDDQGQWLAELPENLQQPLQQRLRQLRLQKLFELRYSGRLEPYFLERRADLEQVVYGVIRLDSQGIAEEFYLRLLEGEAEFGLLAKEFSLGEERYTRGLVGPMPITQPHPTIRQALARLSIGELHEPIRLDRWVLLIQLEHRIPAKLDEPTRQKLLQEIFEQELQESVAGQLALLTEKLANG